MKTYLEREYRHRHSDALIGAAALFLMAGISVWVLITMLQGGQLQDGGIAAILLTLLPLAIAALFFYAGGALAYGWITDRRDHLVIADNGVRHFGKLTAWEDIRLFSAGSKKKGEWMLFFAKNGIGADRYLPVTPPLAKDEIEALLEALEAELAPKFDGLTIGRFEQTKN